MKSKMLSLILILAIAASAALSMVFVYNKTVRVEASIAVISDLHIVSDEHYTQQNYQQFASEEKLIHLSEAVLKTVVDDLIADKKIKTVLAAGDITENGDIASQYAAARILQKLVDAGKQVFIINGNHDGLKKAEHVGVRADADLLREIYHEFGYKQAIVQDARSLSYVADINSKFRIIAIDNDNYLSPDIDGPKAEIDDQLIEWVETQVKQCMADGKTPIAMAHKPLVGHMPAMITNLMGVEAAQPELVQMANALADSGCQYIFTGHLHGQDIASYTSPKGNKLLDIETSSLLFVPHAYRKVKITPNEVRITSHRVEKLNMDYVSPYFPSEDYELLKNDFTAYAYGHFRNAMKSKVMGELSASSLTNMLGLSPSMMPLMELLAENIIGELFNMPLYGEDSLDELITSNGGAALPASDNRDLIDVAAFLINVINSGDENLSAQTPELVILKQGIKSIFYFLETEKYSFEEYFPGISDIEVDVERLFSDGELEVIDSGIIAFVYEMVKDSLPSILQNMNFKNLDLLGSVVKSYMNEAQEGLGTKIHAAFGKKHLNLDILIDDVVYGTLLADALQDEPPADNNVVIKRATLQEGK